MSDFEALNQMMVFWIFIPRSLFWSNGIYRRFIGLSDGRSTTSDTLEEICNPKLCEKAGKGKGKVKNKGKDHPRTGYEGPEVE